ncbi:ras association domain-containing protein 9 [Discoglossus pictus]
MAPFGKKLLKARHKTRSSSKDMEPEDKQIVVWAGQEEKIVCGLKKHTTCSEVVEALLEEHETTSGNNCFLLDHHNEYCIVEKWRGFERILPPATKILKLWQAWGKEQVNLHFVLVKADALLPIPMWRTAEAKVIHNLDQNHGYGQVHYVKTLPLDKQKRVVKKAFRKLAKIKKDIDLQDQNNVQTVMHVIISQDHTIKQQIKRIQELEEEIETFEANLHLDRVENNGANYVQKTYLTLTDDNVNGSKSYTEKDFTKQEPMPNEILHLEEQINHHQSLIRNLSVEIDKEITSMCLGQNQGKKIHDEGCNKKSEDHNLEIIKKELNESIDEGIKLHSQYQCIQKQIQFNDSMLLTQEREYQSLEEDLKALSVSSTSISLYNNSHSSTKDSTVVNHRNAINDFTTALSNLDINDTDSDTGISSAYSQDSEPASELTSICA